MSRRDEPPRHPPPALSDLEARLTIVVALNIETKRLSASGSIRCTTCGSVMRQESVAPTSSRQIDTFSRSLT